MFHCNGSLGLLLNLLIGVQSPHLLVDSEWWDMLARAYAAQGRRVQQHQALAEKYAVDGAYQAAIEQLQIARKAGDGDFYTLSEVDARLHQLERQYREEKQDNKGMPN